MMHRPALAALLLGVIAASPAVAGEGRDLCPDRPGIGTPACTLDPGRVQIEAGIGDWTMDRQADSRTDTVSAGDFLLRVGLGEHIEAQLGWTAFGHVRTRDRATGAVDKASGAGDVTLAVRRNLARPDGGGFAIAVQPYATLPAGGHAIGAGDWGAGLLVPLSYDLSDRFQIALTPEIDAAVDEDRDGRHLSYGTAAGLGVAMSEAVSATIEMAAYRDRDPAGHSTQLLAGLSFALQSGEDMQFDAGANAGLNHATPDIELYLGITRRF